MSGYSGETSFDFEIERYKHKKTGSLTAYLLTEDDPNYEYEVITLKVEGRSYFQPGRTSGLPENCYPDEGETEIKHVLGPDGKDWESQLTHSEHDCLIEMIAEQVMEGGEGLDPDEYYEPDYD